MLTRFFKSLALSNDGNNSRFGDENPTKTESLSIDHQSQPNDLSSSGLAILSLVRSGSSGYIQLAASDFNEELERLGLAIPPLVRSTNDTDYFTRNKPKTTEQTPTYFFTIRLSPPSPQQSLVLQSLKDLRANLGF